VRRLPLLISLLASLVLVVPAAAPAAGPAGFSDPVAVGAGKAGQTAGAVSADGRAALAWTAPTRRGEGLNVALRDGAGQPWRTRVVPVRAILVRDPQVVVAPNGDAVVAWAEIADRSRDQAVAVAAAPAGRELGAVRRFAVNNGFSAFPRLSVVGSGAILLAFRDAKLGRPARLRVALRPADSNRFQAPRTVATGASSLALAASGEGAVMAWATPPRRNGADRTLYALRLDGAGRPRGDRILVSHAAGAAIRVASGGGLSVVSWVRPRHSPARPPALFTRTLGPGMEPARPLVPPVGTVFGGPAAVAMGLAGHALATATALGGEPIGVRVFAARRSSVRGVWTGHQEVSGQPASPSVGDPRPLLLASGEAFVFWSQARAQLGLASYDILVARRAPAATTFAPPAPLSGAVPGNQVGGLLLATGGEHILAAWPASAGGMFVAERG
jgi:hypothetical protein